MEVFSKIKAVKLRSHLDKYLVSDEAGRQESVRQSRRGSSKRAIWLIELVHHKDNAIRLKSICNGKYLTATDLPFLLGMTGNKVLQTVPDDGINMDWLIEWEPIRDGFQFKFKSWCGKFLRANGGTPPWRNSLTHDEPHTGSTKNWILWDVEVVDVPETGSFMEYLSSVSRFSSVSDDVFDVLSDGAYPGSRSPDSPMMSIGSSPVKRSRFSFSSLNKTVSSKSNGNGSRSGSGMDFFRNAKTVRLCSHNDKFLIAEEDEESVTQDRNGSSKNAKWTIERVPGSENIIRLKSCYGKYLTASNQPFLMGMTGRKVTQSLPKRLDSSVEWEPVREANQAKLKTRYGHFLRANGGLPPWRNSVTHDIPHRSAVKDWILWDVHVVEIQIHSPTPSVHQQQQASAAPSISRSDSLDFDSSSPSSASINSGKFSRQESNDSYVGSPPKSEGRTIYYHVADETGEVDDDSFQGFAMTFKGNGVDELTQKLRQELGLQDIVVCTRSPLNGKLFPLRLQLPPNKADMHVTVVLQSSNVAREFLKQGSA